MTTEMKPLEWFKVLDHETADCPITGNCPITGIRYVIWSDGTAWTDYGHWQDVPGPYDGTIETAKQRCEEHRRKGVEVEAGS